MKKDFSPPQYSNRHEGKGQQPHRVAARMEGVVKNRGNRAIKKPARGT